MTALVLREDRDGLAILTLNRPDKLNALNLAMFRELRAHIEALATDDAIGCVVLRGAGRCFCAGNDLGGIAAGVLIGYPFGGVLYDFRFVQGKLDMDGKSSIKG